MKKITKLVALATSLAAITFMGCSNLNTDSSNAIATTERSPSGLKSITLTATSNEDMIKFTPAADAESRTVLPDAIDSGDMNYYLFTKDNLASSPAYTGEKVDFTAVDGVTTMGTVAKDFKISDYSFMLYAVTDDYKSNITAETGLASSDVAPYAAFVAYANADLRYNDNIRFHLKANSSTTGKGHISVKFTRDWELPDHYAVTVALRNIDTDARVYPATDDFEIYANTAAAHVADTTGVDWEDGATGITPGEYNMVVKFNKYNDDDSSVIQTFVYSELAIILMNRTSEEECALPNILEQPPEAPTNFIAGYKIPASEVAADYTVEFAWFDNANNETGFQLELFPLADDAELITLPTSDTEWETIVGTATTTEVYNNITMQASDRHVETAGQFDSLNKNAGKVTITLPLETRYIARLCAVNEWENSEYAYVTLDLTGTRTTTDPDPDDSTAISTGYLDWDDEVQTMNLFRVKYDLNGGTLTSTGTTPATMFYQSQHNKAADDTDPSEDYVPIITPDGITEAAYYINANALTSEMVDDATTTLVSDGNFWDFWYVDNLVNGEKYAEQTVTYVAAGATYIPNIKYYPDGYTGAEKTALAKQPTSTTYNGGKYGDLAKNYFARTVAIDNYTGFKNLTLIAHYDTTKIIDIEIDDITQYEILPKFITTTFTMKTGKTKLDTAETVAATAVKTMDDVVTLDNVLEVSQAAVSSVKFNVNADAKITITTYNPEDNTISTNDSGTYDNVHLKVTQINGNKVKVDQDYAAVSKDWTLTLGEYKPGKYELKWTATTSEAPGYAFSYTSVLYITQ